MNRKKYFVKGMHCSSCELLIEKGIRKMAGVKEVKACKENGEVEISYAKRAPSLERVNTQFNKHGYYFTEEEEVSNTQNLGNLLVSILISILIIVMFVLIGRSDLISFASVDSNSTLPAFIALGLVAGISSCASLVGGLLLSLSKQWGDLYNSEENKFKQFQPHLLFNVGRIISYAFFGFLLGYLGEKLTISLSFGPILAIIVSVIMIILAFQMLNIELFHKLKFSLPKSFTTYISNESNFKGKWAPLIIGGLTFFLPCGFTLTAQSIALLSGDPIRGMLIMFFFALGTLPILLIISFTSAKLYSKPNLTNIFQSITAILVIVLAIFNIKSQIIVLDPFPVNSAGSKNTVEIDKEDLVSKEVTNEMSLVEGKQVIKMDASAKGYFPNYFKVKVGVPVRWEITDKGTSGCTNAVVSKNLFAGEIRLEKGKTSVKEFTPTTPGKYMFSCWMGMVTGTIEVVE